MLQHIKQDWQYRLPHRLHKMRFRGLNRPAYVLLCLLYYSVKSLLFLYFYFAFRLFKFILWDGWRWIVDRVRGGAEEDDDEEYEEYEEESEDDLCEEELPFCQLFSISPDMCLLVDHVEMSPDETAFIRVVDDEGYTPLYKRKVRRDKTGNRFIVFNGTNHYLDDKKTQPIITRK